MHFINLYLEASTLLALLEEALPSKTSKRNPSVFNLRTDESSAKQYFRIYGYLSQQQCMLQVSGNWSKQNLEMDCYFEHKLTDNGSSIFLKG